MLMPHNHNAHLKVLSHSALFRSANPRWGQERSFRLRTRFGAVPSLPSRAHNSAALRFLYGTKLAARVLGTTRRSRLGSVAQRTLCRKLRHVSARPLFPQYLHPSSTKLRRFVSVWGIQRAALLPKQSLSLKTTKTLTTPLPQLMPTAQAAARAAVERRRLHKAWLVLQSHADKNDRKKSFQNEIKRADRLWSLQPRRLSRPPFWRRALGGQRTPPFFKLLRIGYSMRSLYTPDLLFLWHAYTRHRPPEHGWAIRAQPLFAGLSRYRSGRRLSGSLAKLREAGLFALLAQRNTRTMGFYLSPLTAAAAVASVRTAHAFAHPRMLLALWFSPSVALRLSCKLKTPFFLSCAVRLLCVVRMALSVLCLVTVLRAFGESGEAARLGFLDRSQARLCIPPF